MIQDNHGDGNGNRNDGGYRKPFKKPYGKGNGGYGSKGRGSGGGPRDGDRRDFKPRGDRKPYRPREDGDFKPRDGEGGFKPREGGFKPRGDRKDFKPRDGEYKPRGDRKPYKPREGGDFKPRDGEFRPRGDRKPYRSGDGDRKDFKPRGDRRDFKPRDGDRKDFKPHGDRRDFKQRDGEFRPREEAVQEAPAVQEEQRLTIPSTPQKILFKGVDCEVNGRSDLAMALYLHGMLQMSGGCESNALRMLRDAGSKEFRTIRGRMAKLCPEQAMISFDYLCMTLDPGYDGSALRSAADGGDPLAIYYRIRMDDVEGDDPCIDVFASRIPDELPMVEEGLRLLARRRDSPKAEGYIEQIESRKRLKQSIREVFVKSRKGDKDALWKMDKLAQVFPEAEFLRGYLSVEPGEEEDYLREGMSEHRDVILSMCTEFGISKTPYGRFLAAKRLQVNDGEWIHPMIDAVKLGSADAMEELRPVQNRKDVRRSLASVYLANGDIQNLILSCDRDDTTYLDKYCDGDVQRILEVGRVMGGVKEIDWLKKGHLDGYEECRKALVDLASVEERQCKQLVYTLHDVGEDVEAAKLYFEMYGDPTLPAIKWLAKVCENEEAKEYVRGQFEQMGDLQTFDSIFIDDGYRHKPKPKGRSGGFNKGRR